MKTVLVLLLVSVALLDAAGERPMLTPPFGRKWGEPSSGLLQWAGQKQLDVFVHLPANKAGIKIFTFKLPGGGLPGHPADSIEARFYENRLYELTVFYEYPDKTPDEVREVFHGMKKHLTKGRGEFKPNGRNQSVDDGFLTREEAFHHESAPHVFLLMAYSSVEDTMRKKGAGRFSLIYHNGTEGPPSEPGETAVEFAKEKMKK